MSILYWLIIVLLFALSFVGLVYPVIPSVLFVMTGILAYGFFFTFEPFSFWFWLIQGLFVILIFAADWLANFIGIKKSGGSKAGMWGSTIGLLLGPFIIPGLGILLGPFIGAVLGELLINKTPLSAAFKIGLGSLVGFISSVAAKSIILIFMIGAFLVVILRVH